MNNGIKTILLILILILFFSSCSNSEKPEEIKQEIEEVDEKIEQKEISVWNVSPLLECNDIDNWLTSRSYCYSLVSGSGADTLGGWPDDGFCISYDRDDIYNSEGKEKFISHSFEKGGAMFKKDGYWGLVNGKGEITSEASHHYRTFQFSGVVFNDGRINYDYTLSEGGYPSAGFGSGASTLFVDKYGNTLVIDDYDDKTGLLMAFNEEDYSYTKIDLFDRALEKGFVKDDGYILVNTFASSLDFYNYMNNIERPKDYIEGYIIIDKDGTRVLSIPKNYVVNDFSDGIISFARCNDDPLVYPQDYNTWPDYTIAELSFYYYSYELFCDRHDYDDFTFVNREGKIIASGFDDAYGFYEGYAAVKKNDKWGYIDKTGEVVIDFIFDKTTAVSDGSAWVIFDGKAGRLNISELLENKINIDESVLASEKIKVD